MYYVTSFASSALARGEKTGLESMVISAGCLIVTPDTNAVVIIS
jgi:hypothetical protein